MSNIYKFDDVDLLTPDLVINNSIQDVAMETNGYVTAHLESYAGPILSYKTTTGPSLSALSSMMSSKTIDVDIQNDLGEIGNVEHKYELFLSVKGIDKYKYRILFVEFGTISYPVTIVLNEDIADDIFNDFAYVQNVSSMKELQSLMNKILSSHSLITVIQNLINEALRQEKKGMIQVPEAPEYVNR